MHPHIKVPGFHAGGWFDHLTRGQFDAYANIRDNGGTESAQDGQRLLIGPWGHGNIGNTGPDHCRYGDWDLGTEADLPILAHEFQFLDFHQIFAVEASPLRARRKLRSFLLFFQSTLHFSDRLVIKYSP